MVTHSFSISNDEQMDKVKSFIRENMPTCRFKSNPIRQSNGEWDVCITYEIDDINKINVLLNDFYDDDNNLTQVKLSNWNRFKVWLKSFLYE